MTPIGDAKTFWDYAQTFAAKSGKELRDSTLQRLNIVFDRYFKQSLKL